MSADEKLQVKPVLRYRTPRYPSHEDPDPTTCPETVPFPIRDKFLTWVASAGVVASLSCTGSSGQDGSTPEKKLTDKIVAALNAKNPFRIELSGLPHQTSPYGTGVPHYIGQDLARHVIERVFREEGYNLEPKQKMQTSAGTFVADGYDSKRQVGFVVAGFDNLDSDALKRWWEEEPKTKSTDAAIEQLLQSIQWNSNEKQIAAEVEKAKALPDPARREAALRAIIKKVDDQRMSLREAKAAEATAPRTQKFVAVISQYDRRFVSKAGGWTSDYLNRTNEIEAITDPKKKKAAQLKLEEEIAKAAVERLEKSVREYIEWVRSQTGD